MFLLSFKRNKNDVLPMIVVRYSIRDLLSELQPLYMSGSYTLYSLKLDGTNLELVKVEEKDCSNG